MLARTHGVTANTIPFRIIPELGKVTEHSLKSSANKSPDVFNEDEARSKLANEAPIFRPKAASFAFDADALPGLADVLAGEAAADCVNGNSIAGQSLGGKLSHVMIAGNLRPMLRQHAPAERVNLAERDSLKSARALQSKIEAADAREQREDAQLAHSANPVPSLMDGGGGRSQSCRGALHCSEIHFAQVELIPVAVAIDHEQTRLPIDGLAIPNEPEPCVVGLLPLRQRMGNLHLEDVDVLERGVDQVGVRLERGLRQILVLELFVSHNTPHGSPEAIATHPRVGSDQRPNDALVQRRLVVRPALASRVAPSRHLG
jgi:hypothetical protein